jgi:ribonucleoside-diphosphate reductase beta chain
VKGGSSAVDVALDLYGKAKRFGTWDPADIDLGRERSDWDALTPEHRGALLGTCSSFYRGEESVADTLAPWLMAAPRLEERMFLSTQLFEEVKHTEFFARYFQSVLPDVDPAAHFATNLQGVLVDDIAEVSVRIRHAVDLDPDSRLAALIEGVTHYHGIIEGMLAMSGYEQIDDTWPSAESFPGLREGFTRIREDEGRHIAFGMDFLQRKCAESARAREIVERTFARYVPDLIAQDPELPQSAARYRQLLAAFYRRRRQDIGLDGGDGR